ncbi:MAG: response regulator, partial [Myxococcales bacterium]|nr:response regulator [Myxococcales bacterium]
MSAAQGSGAAPPRVLVIDDSEGLRRYLAELLELRGWAVDTAADGRRGLDLLDAGAAPDVVILDVMMPPPDGLETLRRMRAKFPMLPVVMLSVVGKTETIVEAMRLGAHDYLNKPFEEDELLRTLASALRGPESVERDPGDEAG